MTQKRWIEKNTRSLAGKTVALTGATGDLGREWSFLLAQLGADLVLIDRNPRKAEALDRDLHTAFPGVNITHLLGDLENIDDVEKICKTLESLPLDVLIHNAGAYAIPRRTCSTGWDNVFQIDFVSPYYMTKRLMPILQNRRGRVIVVGSIAHNYSHADFHEVDFCRHTSSAKTYGNAKRYLMFSLYELFAKQTEASLSVVHPGIAFTNITSHYPKWLFFLIKKPMKLIFMKPKKAVLSLVKGLFEPCEKNEWIGPWLFQVWGLPKKSRLTTCSDEESRHIGETAEKIWQELEEKTD